MNKYNKEILEKEILVDKIPFEELGRKYGVSGTAVKKAAIRRGIDIPYRRKINEKETFNKGTHKIPRKIIKCVNCGKEIITYASKYNRYCSIKCQHEYQHKQRYKKFCEGDISIMRGNWSPSIFKEDILREQGNKCAICGLPPLWNGKSIVFIADHIDGNAANNIRSNIRCICPNCDSQLDTYKSKNKNGARSYYRYHKYK